MAETKRILVTGATGKQGGAVARHLLNAGFPVRILVRDPGKPAARALVQKGAEVAQGNLDVPASLDPAMRDVHGVFMVSNYWEKGVGKDGELRQGRNVADAARRADVAHFVYASVADAQKQIGVTLVQGKADVERYLQKIGMPTTVLGLTMFMDNFLDPKNGPLLLPYVAGAIRPTTRLHWVAVDDIGAVVAIVLQNPQRYIGKTLDLAGDQMTVAEMRETYRRVTGKKPKGWTLPGFVGKLLNATMFQQLAWNNDPGSHFAPEDTRRVYPDATTFEQFLRRTGVSNL